MQDKCSFCGRNRNEVNLLIAGTDGFICDECASQAYDIVQEEMKSKSTLNLEHQEALKMWKKAAEMGGGVSEELNDKIQSGKLSD